MKPSDRQATAELLVALVETAIAHGRRHYSESGELLATTRAVLAKRASAASNTTKQLSLVSHIRPPLMQRGLPESSNFLDVAKN